MAAPIRMDYFTDPYCAWSWALEPTIKSLIDNEGGSLEIRYHMLPLIEDLAASGKTAEEIAKAWEDIGAKTGVTINADAWILCPPESTLPACRGAKAAEAQGPEAEGRFLQALRPLLLVEGYVAGLPTLLRAAEMAHLDLNAFKEALESPDLEHQIQLDREFAQDMAISSTPGVVLRNRVGDKVVIEGPRDLELFSRAIAVLRVEEEVEQGPEPRVVATELIQSPTPEGAKAMPPWENP